MIQIDTKKGNSFWLMQMKIKIGQTVMLKYLKKISVFEYPLIVHIIRCSNINNLLEPLNFESKINEHRPTNGLNAKGAECLNFFLHI